MKKSLVKILVLSAFVIALMALASCFGGGGSENNDGTVSVIYSSDFWGENAQNCFEYNSAEGFRAIEAPTVPGYRFLGWFYMSPDPEIDMRQMNSGDPFPTDEYCHNVRAVYEPIEYTVNFYFNGYLIETKQAFGATYLYTYSNENSLGPIESYREYKQNNPDLKLPSDCETVLTFDLMNAHVYLTYWNWDESRGEHPNGETLLKDGVIDFLWSHASFYCEYQYLDLEYYTDADLETAIDEAVFMEETNIYISASYVPVEIMSTDGDPYSENAIITGIASNQNGTLPLLDGKLEIPEYIGGAKIVGIADGAFAGADIKQLSLPSSVTKIGAGAFEGSSIEKITVPASVEEIGSGAFKDCTALKTVNILTDVEFDFDNVFENCTAIEYQEYRGAYYLGYYFVAPVSNEITEVNIRYGCFKIPAGAFSECALLERVTIASSVKVIEAEAFSNTALKEIKIPASVTVIGERAFAGTKITSIVIPETVEEIGAGAFANCELLESFEIKTEAELEFSSVFAGCVSIKGEEYGNAYYYGNEFIRPISKDVTWVEIKPGCEVIPANAFRDCTKLSKVYLPKSVKTVGSYAFYNVNSLYFAAYIENYSHTKITWEADALLSVHPETSQPLYYQSKDFPVNVLLTEDKIAYAIESMNSYTGSNATAVVIYGYFGTAKEITVEATYNNMDVQVVYPNAFMDNATLEKVTLKAVKVIGSAAFWNASALREVVLPEDSDCQVIGIRAFYGCEALEKVTAAGGVMCIYRQAFEGCTALREVTVGSAFTAWNSDATESAPFGANSNLAEKLTGDMLTWWFFDPIVDEATAKQLIAAANIT